jgi:electron transport complex protein RnfG
MNMNKTKIVSMMSGAVLLLLAATLQSAAPQKDNVMTKEDGMYVVNTTTLAKDVRGYRGTTPLKIYIKKNKIEKIEVLKNQETPKYLVKVKKAIENAWDGLTVKEAQTKKVDAVTGATFTSEAIIKNVQKGLDHYQKNK